MGAVNGMLPSGIVDLVSVQSEEVWGCLKKDEHRCTQLYMINKFTLLSKVRSAGVRLGHGKRELEIEIGALHRSREAPGFEPSRKKLPFTRYSLEVIKNLERKADDYVEKVINSSQNDKKSDQMDEKSNQMDEKLPKRKQLVENAEIDEIPSPPLSESELTENAENSSSSIDIESIRSIMKKYRRDLTIWLLKLVTEECQYSLKWEIGPPIIDGMILLKLVINGQCIAVGTGGTIRMAHLDAIETFFNGKTMTLRNAQQDFVIFELKNARNPPSAKRILHFTATFNQRRLIFKKINGIFGFLFGSSGVDSFDEIDQSCVGVEKAAELALEEMRKYFYTVKIQIPVVCVDIQDNQLVKRSIEKFTNSSELSTLVINYCCSTRDAASLVESQCKEYGCDVKNINNIELEINRLRINRRDLIKTAKNSSKELEFIPPQFTQDSVKSTDSSPPVSENIKNNSILVPPAPESNGSVDIDKMRRLMAEYILNPTHYLLKLILNECGYTVKWITTFSNYQELFVSKLEINNKCVSTGKGLTTAIAEQYAAEKFLNSKPPKIIKKPETQIQIAKPPEKYDFTEFVVVEVNGMPGKLIQTAEFNKISLNFSNKNKNKDTTCVKLGENFLWTVPTKSKIIADFAVFTELKKHYSTLKIEVPNNSRRVNRSDLRKDVIKDGDALPDENAGHRIMRLMGWAGGGLGKDGTGISQPVRCSNNKGRKGLGSNKLYSFREFLEKYKQSDEIHHLQFNVDVFSSTECSKLTKVAKKLKLQAVVLGNWGFVVKRTSLTREHMDKIIRKNWHSDNVIQLLPPTSSSMNGESKMTTILTEAHVKAARSEIQNEKKRVKIAAVKERKDYSVPVMKKLALFVDDLPKPVSRKQYFVKATETEPEVEILTPPTIETRVSKYSKPRRIAASIFPPEVEILEETITKKIKPIIIIHDDNRDNAVEHHTSSSIYEKLAQIKETIHQFTQKVTNAAQLLGVVLSKCHLTAEWKFQFAPDSKHHEPTFECECLLEEFSVSRGIGKNKKSAKINACQSLISKLSKDNWINNIIPTKPVQKHENNTKNIEISNVSVVPEVEKTDTVVEEPPQVEIIAGEIDLERITKLINKYGRKYTHSGSLLKFVGRICHYSVTYRYSLVSDRKPSNDFNYMCDCIVNGNFVSKGKGKNKKAAMLDATDVFLQDLAAEEEKKQAAKPVKVNAPLVLVPVSDFVIFELPNADKMRPIEILRQSATFNKKKVIFTFSESLCSVTLGTNLIGTAERRLDLKISEIKTNAANSALNFLRKTCYTVKMKTFVFPDSEVSKDDVKGGEVAQNDNFADDVFADNIGNKLLRSMGWTGGGLGKHGTGIKEPIKCGTVMGRRGFGAPNKIMTTCQFHKEAQKVIRNYVDSDANNDLVFSSEFSNEERAVMHKIAHKFGLKTNSRGKGEERYLVVSRKYTPETLIRVLQECGGSNDKYDLVPPAP
uniref:NF-kappa-B-repressing factor n=1 Tax=Strigamia maritima TaxID=126957 RepID=T1J3D8_STRMM